MMQRAAVAASDGIKPDAYIDKSDYSFNMHMQMSEP